MNRFQVSKIKKAVRTHFGDCAQVFVFGSRTDDTKRGGDIDLLVEHDPAIVGTDLIKRKLRTMSDIQIDIGDQKIDIVTVPRSHSEVVKKPGNRPSVVERAKAEGILL